MGLVVVHVTRQPWACGDEDPGSGVVTPKSSSSHAQWTLDRVLRGAPCQLATGRHMPTPGGRTAPALDLGWTVLEREDRDVHANEAEPHWTGIKYRIFWALGTAVSFVVYFTGVVWIYLAFRRSVLRRHRTLVIMYHRVRDDGKDPDLTVSTANFRRQMEYLSHRYRVIPLSEVVDRLDPRPPADADTMAVTFDDGYADNFENALPVLKERAIPATVFLVSGNIDSDDETLTLPQIRLMAESGVDFGSHTVTHPILSESDDATVRREISDSRVELESRLGRTVDLFAYPKGKSRHFDDRAKRALREAGYRAAFCSVNGAIGPRSDRYELRRIGVRNVPLFVFKARLSGIFESVPVQAVRRLIGAT